MITFMKRTATANMYSFHCIRCGKAGFIWIKIGPDRIFNCPHACGQQFIQIEKTGTNPSLVALTEINTQVVEITAKA